MSIGNRISELRKRHNYSQEYVAMQLDVSRQAVSKWELDQTSPDTNNLIALAQLFGVSVEYIATGKTIDVPLDKQGKASSQKETPDQTGANRLLGIAVLGIDLVCSAALWAVNAPSWLIKLTAISMAAAGCFILIFAGKFNYQNAEAFHADQKDTEGIEPAENKHKTKM